MFYMCEHHVGLFSEEMCLDWISIKSKVANGKPLVVPHNEYTVITA